MITYTVYSEKYIKSLDIDAHGFGIGIIGGRHPVVEIRQNYTAKEMKEIALVLNQINATNKVPKSVWYNDDTAQMGCVDKLNESRGVLCAVLSGNDVAIFKGKDMICYYGVEYEE